MPIIPIQPLPELKPRQNFAGFRQSLQNVGIVATKRAIQSSNFVSSVSGWKISAEGDAEFKSLTLYGASLDGTSTIGGRLASILATAIDSIGHFIDANLDTSAKTILGDFTFGVSGALKMITDANSGLWISPTGILGKKLGVETFTIGIDGSANFYGTVAASQVVAGTLTGFKIQTASSGARIEIRSDTTRLNAFNASGQVAELNYGETVGIGILKLTPVGIDARAIEIIIPSGLGASAKGITIHNLSTSISIDMTAAGSTGLNIVGASVSGIIITHSGTDEALYISGAGSTKAAIYVGGGNYPAIEIVQNGEETNSWGIRLTQGAAAVKSGLFIDNNANSHLARGIYIDRDGNIDNQVVAAIRIDCLNAGVGGKACGIDFTGATIEAIMNVAADATAVGTAAGRIPIYVAGNLRYLAYYNA